jgi:hypothetical protein
MTTARQAHSRRIGATSARRKAQAARKKTLQELYACLEKTQPGSEESKRISAQIVDAIG